LANLKLANLRLANLRLANLRLANLRLANLWGSQIDGGPGVRSQRVTPVKARGRTC
jgi:uncharacterized protein YjbI with pentapeptide repeats